MLSKLLRARSTALLLGFAVIAGLITTFIVVFILYCFGGDAIHGFAFALVIGVLVGTYSSIFVASPSLLWLMNTVGLNPGEVDPEAA